MNNISQRDIISFKRALNRLIKEKNNIFIRNGPDPINGSKAKSECQVFPRQNSIESAFSLASTFIDLSDDHLRAFIKTLTKPATAMAPWTCIRGALELSGLAAWILDPSIDSWTRVKRYHAYRYKSLEEERKYLEVIKYDHGLKKLKEHINEIENDAIKLGYKLIINKKNKIISIGQPMPKIIDIIIKMLDKEDFYRLSSAMAHGQHWAFIIFALKEISNDYAFEINITPEHIFYLFLEGSHSFMRPIWYKAQLYGWDLKSITKVFNSFFNSMGIKDDKLRFWNDSIK